MRCSSQCLAYPGMILAAAICSGRGKLPELQMSIKKPLPNVKLLSVSVRLNTRKPACK